MHRLYFVVLLFLSHPTFSQHLTDARQLHVDDEGVLTAGILDASGNLYVASTLNLKTLPGQNGMMGLFPAGDPVISKFAPDGTLLWRHEFPGNFVRICDMAIAPDQELIITGGYVGDFWLSTELLVPGGDDDNASFFIAKLHPDGSFLWVRTHVSTLPEDQIGWTLAVSNHAIYVSGIHDAVWTSLRRYDFGGNLQIEKVLDIRSVSDFALDDEGSLYAVGTASTFAELGGLPIPESPFSTGYANYIARLDSNFDAQWIRSSNYITFDWHPKAAIFHGQPIMLSNDYDLGQNQNGCYQLKAYTSEGNLVWKDSIWCGFFPADYQHFALQSFCDHLLLEFPKAGGMALKSYDANFHDSLLLQSSPRNFDGSFPFLCVQEDRAVFGSNFRNAELQFGDDFTLENDKSPGYQQFILRFDCAEVSGSDNPATETSPWRLAPNPASSTVYLYREGKSVSQGTYAELYDLAGRLCWRGEVNGEGIGISLEKLPVGPYLLRVIEAGKVMTLGGVKE